MSQITIRLNVRDLHCDTEVSARTRVKSANPILQITVLSLLIIFKSKFILLHFFSVRYYDLSALLYGKAYFLYLNSQSDS